MCVYVRPVGKGRQVFGVADGLCIMYTTDLIALAHIHDGLMQHCQRHQMLSSITQQHWVPAMRIALLQLNKGVTGGRGGQGEERPDSPLHKLAWEEGDKGGRGPHSPLHNHLGRGVPRGGGGGGHSPLHN